MIDHESERFGSARWADAADLRRAGLFRSGGLHTGYYHRRSTSLCGDGHGLIVGGAGAGKGRTLLIEMHIRQASDHRWTFDPRGEIAAIVIHNAIRRRAYAYAWNPCGLHIQLGVPQHSVNPLDILDASDPRFDADCKFFAEALVPLSPAANSRYFELRARDVIECVMKALVERFGSVTLPGLYDALMSILSGPDQWESLRGIMKVSRFAEVRRAAAEMEDKQLDAPREFGAIFGTVQEHMHCYSDRMLRRSLAASDFSFRAMTQSSPMVEVYSICPIEYAGIWSSATRVMATSIMLYKSRAPGSPPVTMIFDEAAQLGRFEGLVRAFSYMRGFGVRVVAVFQDVGQIVRNFDASAVQGFIGSAQWRAFLGVRDFQTSELVSSMLGNETLQFDDSRLQEEARRRQWDAARRFMNGEDPFASAFDFAQFGKAAGNRSKMQRPLMTPSEILAMPEDRMISFISGLDVPPIYAHRHAYDSMPSLSGLWLPNPHHGPQDRVKLPGRWFRKWAKVITEPVPPRLSQYPQFQDGFARYVEGFRPW